MTDFLFSLNQLKIIQTIKDEVSIKLLANKLYLSHSTLNFQLKNLEQNTCSKFLIRKQNQLCFTSEGELILDYANKVLGLCKEADKAIIHLKKLKQCSLKIGSSKTIGKYILLKLIDLFCKRYSYANVQLQIYYNKSISWDIINGRLDMGIVFDYEVPKKLYNSVQMTPYFEEKMVLILPTSYQLNFPMNRNQFNLYKLKLITIKPYFPERKYVNEILKKFNINLKQLRIKLQLNSIEAVKRAVQDGLGVAFLSTILAKEELYYKRLNSVSIDMVNPNKQFRLIFNLKNYKSYGSEKFYNYCFGILKITVSSKFLNLDY